MYRHVVVVVVVVVDDDDNKRTTGFRSQDLQVMSLARFLCAMERTICRCRLDGSRRGRTHRCRRLETAPARDRTWNLRNFIEIFNEPVSLGKQFKCCSKRRAIGVLFDDK